ncbi:pentatricopeptide repeat (PPR) superfamily protein [Artemisia annua]|uniref:Pentatricopeptide repeat (PPR) superfamily protein n=1 Tax=Artemisia annua TaxID=35608 RepID=A0A2U1MJW8_ARTAN|nr:pentatricopeptide repeat (PPR) superfamily protein [Artemisia annua]
MPQPNVFSWNNTIIRAYCGVVEFYGSRYAQDGFFMEVLELFREMQMEGGVTPNYVSLISVLLAVSGLGALEIGKWD